MSDRYTRQANAIIKGRAPNGRVPQSLRYHCFPLLAGAGVTGIALTVAGGPAWSAAYGAAWTTIANGAGADITTEFFVCGLYCYTGVAATVYEIQMTASAAPVNYADVYAEMKFEVTGIPCQLHLLEVGPYPIWQPATQLVAARIGGSSNKAVNVHLYYAVGL